ncbi:MAG: chorismate-binding protein [Polyangiales bacterium]
MRDLDAVTAAAHLAAARGSSRVSARLPGAEGRAPSHALASLLAPEVSVPAERAEAALAPLAEALDALCAEADGPPELPVATLWLSYDAARAACDPRPVIDRRPLGDRCPAALLARHEATLVWGARGEARHGPADALARLDEATRDARDRPATWAPLETTSATSRDAFVSAVNQVRGSIAAGDVYLVNVARRLESPPVEGATERVATRVIASRAARAMLANVGGVTVGGMSMELALRWDRRRGVAWTAPIKGTRPRRADAVEDAAEVAALLRDPKERSENAMAVDVHRNDLSRVATRVTAPRLFEAETHAFVHHLTSWVRAEVPRALGAEAMLRAVLPVGSVTGAPKLAAMDLIARLEPSRRGLYTGVYGTVFADGSVELAVAIRTLVADPSGISYGVGGGVVWDSDPAAEWDELGWKSRAIR